MYICPTCNKKFKTEDKPWLDCRFTAMLPIKFEIKQCLELKEMEVIKI